MNITSSKPQVSAIILAGGQGQRMNGKNKGLQTFKGSKLINHVIDRISPQVNEILISANKNVEEYEALGYTTYRDEQWSDCGPIGGILTTAHHAANDYLLIVACDQPFLPPDLVEKLYTALGNNKLAVAADATGIQNLNILMHKSLLPSMQQQLVKKHRSMHAWLALHPHSEVFFHSKNNDFANINTLDDLTRYA